MFHDSATSDLNGNLFETVNAEPEPTIINNQSGTILIA
jgi:hypothetical protein